MTTTIDQIRNSLGNPTADPAYRAKQMHEVPPAPSIGREAFILERAAGKRVLDIGASGPMAEAIRGVVKEYWGIDREASPGVFAINLDSPHAILPNRLIDLVICGEVIEHLSNPGLFLGKLIELYPDVPVIVTVPNAYSEVGARWMEKGTENVNLDHVAYYSWTTLKTLVERVGYRISEFFWYGGRSRFSEGMIAVLRSGRNG